MPRSHPEHFFRYVGTTPEEELWRVHVCDAGGGRIPSNAPYPTPGHPDDYALDWNRGRVLDEFQITLITHGRGVFESRSAGSHTIAAGNGFILFPDEWHRYRPDIRTGWTEHWVGFKGDYANSLVRGLFAPEHPVFEAHGHLKVELHALLDRIAHTIRQTRIRDRTSAIVDTLAIIARLHCSKAFAAPVAGDQLEPPFTDAGSSKIQAS